MPCRASPPTASSYSPASPRKRDSSTTTALPTSFRRMPVVFLQGGGNFAREIRDQPSTLTPRIPTRLPTISRLNLGLRYELPFPSTEIHNAGKSLRSRRAVEGDSERSGGTSLSRRSGRAGGLDSNAERQPSLRASVWLGIRAATPKPWSARLTAFSTSPTTPAGWPAAGSHQRAAVPEDSAVGFPIHSFANPYLSTAQSFRTSVSRSQ